MTFWVKKTTALLHADIAMIGVRGLVSFEPLDIQDKECALRVQRTQPEN